jgi:hypothetical protein
VAADVPADQQPAIGSRIRACLRDRVAEKDPDAQPASCRTVGSAAADPAIGRYAQAQVREGFTDATVRTLGVAFLLLLVAFAVTFVLPRHARPAAAPETGGH